MSREVSPAYSSDMSHANTPRKGLVLIVSVGIGTCFVHIQHFTRAYLRNVNALS